jgi:hypothetical protein
LYDVSGRQLYSWTEFAGTQPAGAQTRELQIPEYIQAGTYLIGLNLNGQQHLQRLILN